MTDYCIIPLTRGMSCMVDPVDYDRFGGLRWYAQLSGRRLCYARRDEESGGRRRRVMLHREIVGALPNQLVDHANGDTLDNRRSNLRLCTHQQNSCNIRVPSIGSTGFYGVERFSKNRWGAVVRVNGARFYSRSCQTIEEAAREYDKLAAAHHGEFAKINFPEAA